MSLFLLFPFLSFFLSFLFFSLYFSFFYFRKYLSQLVHLRWTKQIFSFSFFPFLNIYIYIYIYIFQYLGRVEGKTVLSCTYLFEGFLRFFSFTSERHFSRIGWVSLSADYCPKILFYAFYGPYFLGIGCKPTSLSVDFCP